MLYAYLSLYVVVSKQPSPCEVRTLIFFPSLYLFVLCDKQHLSSVSSKVKYHKFIIIYL